MNRKQYRFFGGLLTSQEKWLNKMADNGYRLVRVGKLLYEFEECEPGKFRYCVEFVGHKSKNDAQEYYDFLEDMGYHVFYKNINLNYSFGKVCWRPWAEPGGQIATNSTTFNRELLIVEKLNNGTDFERKDFELHTSYEDKIQYYNTLKKPYYTLIALFVLLAILSKSVPLVIFALILLVPVIIYQFKIRELKKEAKTKEW